MLCPCHSNKLFKACCEPYLNHTKLPTTPEALMRSRYTAFTKGDVSYIEKTMKGKALIGFDKENTKAWTNRVIWIDLNVVNAANPDTVEFIARFIEAGRLVEIHEKSDFNYEADQWFYVGGEQLQRKHNPQKIERNSLCPCQSGKKFKRCHGFNP